MSMAPYEYQPPALAPNGWAPAVPVQQPPRPPTQLEKLAEWAQAAQAAYSVAQKLVTTSFVPVVFRGKPEEATAAILCGAELDLSPMASLRAFHPIQGVAAPAAMTLRAVVQSKGHQIWEVETTDTRAVVQGQRRGSDKVQESVWTIERASGLGLPDRNPQWKKQPKAMLIARATSECARMVAADAILGIPYSVEELEDGGPLQATAEVTPMQEEPKRTARRKTQPARPAPANTRPAPAETVQDGPPLPGEDDDPSDEEQLAIPDPDEGDAITKAQLTKLAITLKEAGVTDRERGLKLESILTGRDITSSKDLTKAEASNIIDHLERLNSDDVAAIIDGDGDQQ